jgi:putative ABC transport system permease protein
MPPDRNQIATVQARLRRITGIRSVASGPLPLILERLPMSVSTEPALDIRDLSARSRNGDARRVNALYLSTVGTAIVDGRDFADGQDATGRSVILSESLARSIGGGRRLVGESVYVNGPPMRVVGIAADTFASGPLRPPDRIVYELVADERDLVVRTAGAPELKASDVAGVVRQVTGADGPVRIVYAADLYARLMGVQRVQAIFLGLIAALTGLLGLLSVFAATSETVHLRLREAALRMALGASPVRAGFRMLGRIILCAAVGAAAGLAGGVVAGHWAGSLWFHVKPQDAASLVFVAAIAFAAVAVAMFGPARLLISSLPMRLLREE